MLAYIPLCFGRLLWNSHGCICISCVTNLKRKWLQQGGHTSCLFLRPGSFNAGIISTWQVARAPLPDLYRYCLMRYQMKTSYHKVCRDFISVQIKEIFSSIGIAFQCLSAVYIVLHQMFLKDFRCPLLVGWYPCHFLQVSFELSFNVAEWTLDHRKY